MIRKIIFAVTLVALVASGVRPVQPAAGATAVTSAAQSCTSLIEITKFNILRRTPGGGHEVAVDWNAPQLPACVAVERYRVFVALKFPKIQREEEQVVSGALTAVRFIVNGFLTDTTPQTFTVRVTADLKTVAKASGSKSGQATINP
jgi:hypothetical protein